MKTLAQITNMLAGIRDAKDIPPGHVDYMKKDDMAALAGRALDELVIHIEHDKTRERRDLFAAHALQGLLASDVDCQLSPLNAAKAARTQADVMLSEQDKDLEVS